MSVPDIKEKHVPPAKHLTTVEEYLCLLRVVARHMDVVGRHGMLFCAAAVSDFYVPRERLSVHKIDSGGASGTKGGPGNAGGGGVQGGLTLHLDDVPKCLGLIGAEWAPDCFRVSFKLETDLERLMPKARRSLERYGMHMVVANELHSRYDRLELVLRGGEERTLVRRTADGRNHVIEEELVDAVASEHFKYITDVRPFLSSVDHDNDRMGSSWMSVLLSTLLSGDKSRNESGVDGSINKERRRRQQFLIGCGRVALTIVGVATTLWVARIVRGGLSEMFKDGLLGLSAGEEAKESSGGSGRASGSKPVRSMVSR